MDFEKPYPTPTPTSEPYWSALRDDRVLLQKCQACGSWNFYPRSHCSHCLSPELEWLEVSGTGTLYTYTIAHQPTAPHFADEVPQILCMVTLDEGVRLTSTLVNVEPNQIRVNMPLKPYFDHINESTTLLRFEPADA